MSTPDTVLMDVLGGDGWIDISRPLSPETPVWPGDRGLEFDQRSVGDVLVTAVSSTCHIGTHVDAPLHLSTSGTAVHEIPLGHLIGPAEIVQLPRSCVLAGPKDLPLGWVPRFPKVLLRSDSHLVGAPIRDGFSGLSAELVGWFADHDVTTIGIDTPSVDVFSSTELEAHHALVDGGMTWIEGLDLMDVEAGCYLLIALPTPLRGIDAAPVRALVKKLPEVVS